MLQNNEKSAEVLKAEKIVEQAKARLAEAKRRQVSRKRKEENSAQVHDGWHCSQIFPKSVISLMSRS